MSRPVGEPGWLNHREVKHLRALRASGKTVQEIHELTGFGRATISRHTSDLGPRPGGWRGHTRTVATELAIVGLSGRHPQKEIAELVGCGVWTVHDVQRKYHIVQRFGRQHAAARRYAYDEHAMGTVLEHLYVNLRLTQRQVAERMGLDIGTVRRRLEALGFRIRTHAESNRGHPHRRHDFSAHGPECASPNCTIRVLKPGETHCSRCRHSRARREGR